MRPVPADEGDSVASDRSCSDSHDSDDELREVLAIMHARKKTSARHKRDYDRHLVLLEDRVAELEKQLRLVHETLKNNAVTPAKDDLDQSHEESSVERARHSAEKQAFPSNDQDQGIVNNIVEPIQPTIKEQPRDRFHTAPSRKAIDVLMSNFFGSHRAPEQIRFNSLLLITTLKNILGAESNNHGSAPHKGWIIFWPFKAFLESGEKIRGKMALFKKFIKHSFQQDTTNPESTEERPASSKWRSLNADAWRTVLKSLRIYCCEVCTEAITLESPTGEHTMSLLSTVTKLMDDYITPVTEDFRKRTVQKVRFRDLWYLFQPGDEVVAWHGPKSSHTLGLKVLRTHGGRQYVYARASISSADLETGNQAVKPVMYTTSSFSMDGFYLDYDGNTLTPVRQRFVIEPYEGERKVTELCVFPIEYSEQPTRQDLIARGHKFLNLARSNSGAHMASRGLDLAGEAIDDEVIVDMREFLRLNPNHTPKFTPPQRMNIAEINDYMVTETMAQEEARRLLSSEEEMTEKDFVLCHYRLHVYKLRSRTWNDVHVDTLNNVTPAGNSLGFDLLVLPDGHKDILQSQIEEHTRRKDSNIRQPGFNLDVVQGKGQGLVILLHGVPGVGKTSTAECIAELVQKPLYSITCGALGTTTTEIEKNLSRHLALASRWDCVVLLDEADLFLSRRGREDFHRNGVVVLFLRTLDYYSGIIVMTTNRVGALDEGFLSRIHISLFYPEFDNAMIVKVWETFIQRAKTSFEAAGRTDIVFDSKAIMRFVRQFFSRRRWNGRQIRNAFQAAIAMAEYNARKQALSESESRSIPNHDNVRIIIGRREFMAIAASIEYFDAYMTETWGADREGQARRERLRSSGPKWDDLPYGSDTGLMLRKRGTGSARTRKAKLAKELLESSGDSSSEDTEPLADTGRPAEGSYGSTGLSPYSALS